MVGSYGNSPWGGAFGGGSSSGSSGSGEENIPNSNLWTQFDLTGVEQEDDMDRVLDFIETSAYGASSQFFINSFNLASGGSYPETPALLDIAVPVTETYTVEYRMKPNGLPDDFDDPVLRHMLLSVNNAAGACSTLLLSQAGVAYTGAVSFDAGGQVSFDHILNPAGTNTTEKSLIILPGSDEWFNEGDELYIRFLVDWENQLAYLFITPAADITPGFGNTDSTGHVLRALLPVIPSDTAEVQPIDRVAVSVRGTAADESNLELFHYNLSSRVLVPDLPPRALAGSDQASRLCSVIQLDGSGSFDPEGNDLGYDWRLVEAPDTSQFVEVGNDGYTQPEAIVTGFTDQFFSPELGTVHNLEPIAPGDVLLAAAIPYTIASTKPDEEAGDFYVLVERPQIPDDLASAGFKLLRQAGLTGATTEKPTFYPDVAGFYLFDLRVFDGLQWSTPTGLQRAVTVVNVLESPLPRGCTPDVSFIFDYLSDFWKLVEDSEKMGVFWGAMAQSAATEMFTLWQHDYSKSIRDIQRTFTRRWLHYDLVLGEPLPELTKTFPVWGGVVSSPFTELRVNNQKFGIASPLLPAAGAITFTGYDPVDPSEFAAGFERNLQTLHESFSVSLITLNSGEQQLRIDADIPFTVTEQTTILFTPGDTNGSVLGTGAVETERTFKVDRSLLGMNLVEAFLVLGDETYTIDRVLDVAGDEFPFQRVVLRRDLVDAVGSAASYVISGWVSSELLNFYAGLVTSGDHVDFEVLDTEGVLADNRQTALLVSSTAYGASPLFPKRLPVDFTNLGQYLVDETLTVRLALVLRRGHVPVDELVLDVPVLQENIVISDDEATLRRNLDFYLEEFRGQNSIRFVSGQNGGPDVFEGAQPPSRLWAEYTYLNNNPTIEANFGELVELTEDNLQALPPNFDYLSAVSGLMYAYTNGPAVRNLRIGTQILLGLPYAEEDGTIEEIRDDLLSDNARLLIRDADNTEIVRSYSYPKILELEVNPATGERYAVGDSVTRFEPLVEGAEVIDYVKEPEWFEGIVNQGVFLEVQKFHTFAVRVAGDAFSLSTLLFVRNFILKIKPTYTFPKFVVQLLASEADGDEISVNDTVTMAGLLTLEDGVCAHQLGASTSFDQPWPGGGQQWAQDPNGHGQPYRNRFDHDDDPYNPDPTLNPYVPDAVQWGYDKGILLCPQDELLAWSCEDFGADFTPPFDSVFKYDTGTVEALENTVAGPVNVPAGTTGVVVASDVMTSAGNLTRLNLALMGDGAGAEAEHQYVYEAVIWVDGSPVHAHLFRTIVPGSDLPPPPDAAHLPVFLTNQEMLVTFGPIPIAGGETVEVTIRTVTALAASTGWDEVLVKLSNDIMWTFDDTLTAGVYCNVRDLVP